MQNTLTVLQLVIVLLLITIILLQKPRADTAASLGGSNPGAAQFNQVKLPLAVKITWFLVALFLGNSLLIARFSYQENNHNKRMIEDMSQSRAAEEDGIGVFDDDFVEQDGGVAAGDKSTSGGEVAAPTAATAAGQVVIPKAKENKNNKENKEAKKKKRAS